MAKKFCQKCQQEKTIANFIAIENSIMFDKIFPVCRDCIKQLIASAPVNEKWNTVDQICQCANIPFIPDKWEECYEGYGNNAFGPYATIFRSQEYSRLNWKEYNDVYCQLKEHGAVEAVIPAIAEKKRNDLWLKWGDTYDDESLVYLENLHQGILASQNVVGALNEDQALKLCKISLVIEEKIREGADFSKDLKSYEDLAKLSNLTSKNIKEAEEFNSFGEVFSFMEKSGTTIPYYEGAVNDEVDFTMKNIKNYLRYLYTNETGIAEEIEQRIDNLKIAAEYEQDDFNETDFRQFQKEQELEEENEDFKVDLE